MKTTLLSIAIILGSYFQSHAQSAEFQAAQIAANAYVSSHGLEYQPKRNVFTGHNDNVIHIFMFEDGNLLLAGYPTVATEKSKFQLHLFVQNTNASTFLLEYTGSYSPILNIQNGNSSPAPMPAAGAVPPPIVISQLDFAILGPFTNTLVFTLKERASPGDSYNTLVSTTIQISKTFYASIGSGIVYTSLKDPSNIRKIPLGATDSTLVADNTKGRSLLTLMATFYPWGRNNLMMPEWNLKDRFGIVVGTTIGSDTSSFKNLLLGAQYDFSIGGSFIAGLHYGQRQKIIGVDYKDFKFGESKFEGDLESKKYTQGDLGLFFGVAIDSRIFSQIFK
ncbi:hypothetical protein [Flavobacterium sp. FlaQc-48]|uniref:hypothetical protein n=1 Tax=Flavobacterium sp. FlaQc-48 TaxID=3374181 RepID=UPI00375650AA